MAFFGRPTLYSHHSCVYLYGEFRKVLWNSSERSTIYNRKWILVPDLSFLNLNSYNTCTFYVHVALHVQNSLYCTYMYPFRNLPSLPTSYVTCIIGISKYIHTFVNSWKASSPTAINWRLLIFSKCLNERCCCSYSSTVFFLLNLHCMPQPSDKSLTFVKCHNNFFVLWKFPASFF